MLELIKLWLIVIETIIISWQVTSHHDKMKDWASAFRYCFMAKRKLRKQYRKRGKSIVWLVQKWQLLENRCSQWERDYWTAMQLFPCNDGVLRSREQLDAPQYKGEIWKK